MLCRNLLAALLVIAATGTAAPALSDEPKVKVEIRGPDGKPAGSGKMFITAFGELTPKKTLLPGELVTITAFDDKGNAGSKVVEVPRTGSLAVSLDLTPPTAGVLFFDSYSKAQKASEAGDLDGYAKHALDAKENVDRRSELLAADQKMVDDWAQRNNLPILSYEELTAAVERGKNNGLTSKNSTAFRLLEQYRGYQWSLGIRRALLEFDQKQLKQLKTPERRTTMTPGACPDGQGGGLLAGWLNSVTGSGLAAVCGIDVRREKNKPDARNRPEDRDDHGDD